MTDVPRGHRRLPGSNAVLLLVGTFAAIYGVKLSDAAEFRAIALDPFRVSVPPDHQFLYGSPFTFLLGNYYVHHAVDVDAAFYIVAACGVALLAIAMHRAFGAVLPREARPVAILVLFTSPMLLVVSSFVGKSDPYLIAFFLLLTTATSAGSIVILATAIPLCHSELGAIILVGYLCLHPGRWRPIVTGLAAGELLILTYTRLLVSGVPESRIDYAARHAADLWPLVVSHPVLHAVGALGPFWLFVGSGRLNARSYAVLGMAAAASVVAQDFTRVFLLAALPLVVDLTIDAARELATEGALRVGSRRVAWHALWPLVLTQFQIAGSKLLSARGLEWVFG